jgi:predicted MFS family arabinose efflux permease
VRGFVAALVLIAIGIALAAAAGGRVVLQAAGLAIAGCGTVVGVAAAFWVVGRSEDRARERGEGGPYDDPRREGS